MRAYADKMLRRMRAYTHTVRRLNRRFDVWTISLPLWRFAIGYYAVLLLATYVISWTSSRSPQFSWAGGPTSWHFTFPAILTSSGVLGRNLRRRRLGLSPPRRRSNRGEA